MITVGCDAMGYREHRNFAGLPVSGVRYRRVRSVWWPIATAYSVLLRRSHERARYSFQDFGLSRADLHHFFFSISYGPTPWIVTHSSFLPRWNKLDRRAIERLADDRCRALLPLSQHAWDVQRNVLRHNADLVAAIERKAQVLHPAQAPLVENCDVRRAADGPVSFAFVGKQFFLKGGNAILNVFERLAREGAPVHLHVVSSMEYRDKATRSTPDDVRTARERLAAMGDRVTFHGRLPNAQVLDLFRTVDVALLPTIADTYGYVVLEAQACGCPVISTDVQALPEINDDECGWLVRVPRNEIGRAARRTPHEITAFDETLEAELERCVRDALSDRDAVRRKGERALERIRLHHDPERAARRLEGIYARAIEGVVTNPPDAAG